jgi:hypothetical protein
MGIFRVYEDNNLIAEAHNLTTHFGRREILKIQAGQAPRINRLLVGCLDSPAPAATQETLILPLAVEPVVFSTPIYNQGLGTGKVVYKARLPESVGGVIYELAASNNSDAVVNSLVTISVNPGEYVYAGTQTMGPGADISSTNTNIRRSPYAAGLTAAAGASPSYTSNIASTIAGAVDSDVVCITGYNSGALTATLTLRLTDVNGQQVTKSGVTLASASYTSSEFTIGSMSIPGAFDRSAITKIEVFRTDAAAITTYVDGVTLRSPTLSGRIISRATVAAISKKLGSKMDIEYEMPVTF